MSEQQTIKKRVQFTIDEGTAKAAEYLLHKAGISSGSLMSMVYSEIANTGKIPVQLRATENDFLKSQIIREAHKMTSVSLDNDKAIDNFLNDDGGY